MNKLETIKYFLSKVEDDSAEGMACIREIIEDFKEPINKNDDDLKEMIKSCNE